VPRINEANSLGQQWQFTSFVYNSEKISMSGHVQTAQKYIAWRKATTVQHSNLFITIVIRNVTKIFFVT